MSDLNKSKKFRFKFLVYPKFQVIVLFCNFITLFLIFFAINFKIGSYFNQMRKLGEDASFAANHTFYRFLTLQEAGIESSLFQLAVISIVISTIIFLVISHRISGPFVRLRSYFGKMAQTSKFEKISFRKRDFFSELPNLINEAFLAVSSKSEEEQNDNDNN